MVERIRTLLETRQLTPTQFADAIGVARPIVSHILSGRNKPSLEVVQRILAAMPDLSMPWLLNGTGPMQAAAPAPVVAHAAPPVPVPNKTAAHSPVAAEIKESASNWPPSGPAMLHHAPTNGAAKPMPRRFTSVVAKPEPNSEAAMDKTPAAQPAPDMMSSSPDVSPAVMQEVTAEPEPGRSAAALPLEHVGQSVAEPNADSTATALYAGAEKPIRRIVIFYRDGSFADYRPE